MSMTSPLIRNRPSGCSTRRSPAGPWSTPSQQARPAQTGEATRSSSSPRPYRPSWSRCSSCATSSPGSGEAVVLEPDRGLAVVHGPVRQFRRSRRGGAAARRRPMRMRKTRSETQAKRLARPRMRLGNRAYSRRSTPSTSSPAMSCWSRPGDIVPSDGEVVAGIASVNESAITGESAPVIRESGGDRSAVTGGTTVLSDQHQGPHHGCGRLDLHRPHDRPRRGRRAAEDSERARALDPAVRPHHHLPDRLRERCGRIAALFGRDACR